jgi:hypothetical protein
MFSKATADVREALYGIMARTSQGTNTTHNMGSGIMIAPNYIITNSHVIHLNSDVTQSVQREILVIRSPDIGRAPIIANLAKEDTMRDLALLKIEEEKSRHCVVLENRVFPSGTICGSLGFPLSTVAAINGQCVYNLTERFQGAFISSYLTERLSERLISWYEVDRVMYGGSSGCPFYLENANVIGLQTRVRTEDTKDETPPDKRSKLAISLCIPSIDIIKFGKDCGVI